MSAVKVKKTTKLERAVILVQELQEKNFVRKAIIGEMSSQLDTTWAGATTLYYKVLNQLKSEKKEV